METKTAFPPDFFIVGAPKCGTSALFTYLSEHDGTVMPGLDTKEPHFFCTDLPNLLQVRNQEAYGQLFAGARDDQLKGEASTLYLFSEVAIDRILEANPRAKILIMLRNPIDIAYSFHNTLCNGLKENVLDFEEAWRLQDQRLLEQQLPSYCPEPKVLQYRDIAAVGSQVERAMAKVPADQLKIIFFEDFARHTQAVYQETLAFLGLPFDGRTEFPSQNEFRQLPNNAAIRALRNLPGFLYPVIRFGRMIWKPLGFRPTTLLRAFAKKGGRTPLSPAFRAELGAVFEDEMQKLEQSLGVDLAHWRPNHEAPANREWIMKPTMSLT